MQNLYDQAKQCLTLAAPADKVAFTAEAAGLWNAGQLIWTEGEPPELLNDPGRLDKPAVVMPRDLPKRKPKSEEGRAALIHSLAHIELTAINLAWDTIYRYRDMPKEYYDDWVKCANEEAGHFILLRDRLREMGYDYGSFPVHNELWKMAVTTADDLMDRMGIVHRAFEARALDVVPKTLQRFEHLNDRTMVKALTIICNDEVGHVSSGTRWFHYRCAQRQLDPDTTFFMLLEKYMKKPLSGPFNHDVRLQSGFSENELRYLEENAKQR
ncbi:hypothetical protein BGP75_20150 [Motiliproteus sp. MSK22-1]|nr:hypothetical protein BGP75_20150 [Motiliproteus sp. MSK22-1]